MESLTINIEETRFTLSEEQLLLHQQYVIRVRVKYEEEKLPNAVWSDWSKEYSWTSAVGQKPHTLGNTHKMVVLWYHSENSLLKPLLLD